LTIQFPGWVFSTPGVVLPLDQHVRLIVNGLQESRSIVSHPGVVSAPRQQRYILQVSHEFTRLISAGAVADQDDDWFVVCEQPDEMRKQGWD
jgi:hypothetical protein